MAHAGDGIIMKYLISLYFDDSTNKKIFEHMKAVAYATGNDYMLKNSVPPHITISSFELDKEEDSSEIRSLEQSMGAVLQNIGAGELQWVGCGAFMSSVLYLAPVLNEYLQTLMEQLYACVSDCPDAVISRYYRPYEWLAHTTIGKKMSAEQLTQGFHAVQGSFHIIKGKVVRIGLAKANPYEEISEWILK